MPSAEHATDQQAYYQTPGHLVAAGMVLPVVDIIAVALRIAARKKQRQPFQMDDWLMLPATLLTLGIGILLTWGVSQRALGYRMEVPPGFQGDPLELTTHKLKVVSKSQYAYVLMIPLALGCIKSSIVFFYLRIFSTATGTIHVLLVALNVLIGMWTVTFFFASLFQCGLDMWAIWSTVKDMTAHCHGTMYMGVALCATDFLVDIFIICIPIPPIWRLKLSTPKKIAASIVFLIGSVTIVASLIRLIMQCKTAIVGFDPNEDAIFVITEYLYWGMVECGVGIFAACLPVLQSLFRKFSWAPVLQSVRGLFGSKAAGSEYANMKAGDQHSTPSISSAEPVPASMNAPCMKAEEAV